ncbi:MAG: rod shape-determining protein MreD [Acidimicrobiia bacterium]
MNEPGAWVSGVRMSLVIFLALLLQTAMVANMTLFGVQGDLLVLVGVAAGLSSSPDRGAFYGFAAGLAYDLVLHTPFGLSALVYALVGYVAGLGRDVVLRSTWWIPVCTAAACSALAVVLYVLIGTVLGRSATGLPVLKIAVVVAAMNAILALPAVRLVRWCTGGEFARTRPVMR